MEVVGNTLANALMLSALGFVFGTAVHELSHVVTARAAGYEAVLETFTTARIRGEFDVGELPVGVRLALLSPVVPGVAFLGSGIATASVFLIVAGARCALLSQEDLRGVTGSAA